MQVSDTTKKSEAFARGSLARIHYELAKRQFFEAIEQGEFERCIDLGRKVQHWSLECDKADDIWWKEVYSKMEDKL